MPMYMHGWIPRGWATASATAFLGPWPDSSVRPQNHPLRPVLAGRDYGLGHGAHHHRPQHQGGGRLRHQVVGTGVAQYHKQTCLFAAPGCGGAQDAAFSPRLRLRPGDGYASEEPGMVATAVRRIVATSEAEVILAASLAQNGAGFSLHLHNNKQIATISNRSCFPWR